VVVVGLLLGAWFAATWALAYVGGLPLMFLANVAGFVGAAVVLLVRRRRAVR
jgi:hypothetical protein